MYTGFGSDRTAASSGPPVGKVRKVLATTEHVDLELELTDWERVLVGVCAEKHLERVASNSPPSLSISRMLVGRRVSVLRSRETHQPFVAQRRRRGGRVRTVEIHE